MERVSRFVHEQDFMVIYQNTPESTHITVHDMGALRKPEYGGHVTPVPEHPIGYISPELLVYDPAYVTICHDCYPQDGGTSLLEACFDAEMARLYPEES
jgi:hypothetical protein